MKHKKMFLTTVLIFLPVSSVFAGEAAINSGDTAWGVIVSTALVMMMTPAGLALFYGGMSRYKNFRCCRAGAGIGVG